MSELSKQECGALFLDRDGVLNELVVRDGRRVSPRRLADFVITAGASEGLRTIEQRGFGRFVVTNQPDIARGAMAPNELKAMHSRLHEVLPLTDIAFCPHDDGFNCQCRKPKPGLILALASKWNISLQKSVIIGDTSRDIEAGRAAGCRTILLNERVAKLGEDIWAARLSEALDAALGLLVRLNKPSGATGRE